MSNLDEMVESLVEGVMAELDSLLEGSGDRGDDGREQGHGAQRQGPGSDGSAGDDVKQNEEVDTDDEDVVAEADNEDEDVQEEGMHKVDDDKEEEGEEPAEEEDGKVEEEVDEEEPAEEEEEEEEEDGPAREIVK